MTQTKVEQRGTKHNITIRTLNMFMQKYLSSLLLVFNFESCNNRSDMPPPWHATLNDGNWHKFEVINSNQIGCLAFIDN